MPEPILVLGMDSSRSKIGSILAFGLSISILHGAKRPGTARHASQFGALHCEYVADIHGASISPEIDPVWTVPRIHVQTERPRGARQSITVDERCHMESERSTKLAAALRAAQEGRRDDLRALLNEVTPCTGRDAKRDEWWLAAEAAYLQGDYVGTIDLFERFDHDSRGPKAPPWQRYLSAHRRAFASLQLGRIAMTAVAIDEADEILRSSPELTSGYADLTAMRGHLHELRGDFESARASFELAYASALRSGDANRAMTTASDLGRVFGILGRPADGLMWLRRAEEESAHASNAGALTTIRLRRAMLLAALGQSREALGILGEVLVRAQENGGRELLVDALAARADVWRTLAQGRKAEHDLLEAIRLASAAGLVRHELRAHRDLASLYAEQAAVGDETRAAAEFAEAIRLAAALVPPQPLVLMQLAESALTVPALVGRPTLPSGLRGDLESALESARRGSVSSIYQRRERSRAFERANGRLSALLMTLADERIALATHVVLPRAGRVLSTAGEARHINAAEIATLQLLRDGPLTIQALSERLGKSMQAASKSVMRLRSAIENDLVVTRVGQERRYSLWMRNVD
jgi:tetratricopeptide (TPR) repeat protein